MCVSVFLCVLCTCVHMRDSVMYVCVCVRAHAYVRA